MAWLAVNKDGSETIFQDEPKRIKLGGGTWVTPCGDIDCVSLLEGSIEKLIGKKLTWEDESVEMK